MINIATHDQRLEKAREICWQIQKGLFNNYMEIDYEYNPDEMKYLSNSSSISNDTGFTFISNRQELPFFSIFPEPEQGYGAVLKYDDKYRMLFEAFADPYVLKSFFHLYSKKDGYTFEKEVLEKECDIPEDKIDDVMAKLCRFCFSSCNQYVINGEERILYIVRQRYELVAVFAMLNELIWHSNAFCLQASHRNRPYFEKK